MSFTLSDERAGSFALSSAIHDLFDSLFDSKKAWRPGLGRQFLKSVIEGRDLLRKNIYLDPMSMVLKVSSCDISPAVQWLHMDKNGGMKKG